MSEITEKARTLATAVFVAGLEQLIGPSEMEADDAK